MNSDNIEALNWEKVEVSSKILGHIGAGIYRSAAGALKELVSNSFDADATQVVITTNWPSFDTITCFDNGSGMTEEEFRRVMVGGIGDSLKRSNLAGMETPKYHRPVIGRLGIGMLGIAQVCHEFKIVSHHTATKTAFSARVRLIDFLRETVDKHISNMPASEIVTPDLSSEEDINLDVGQFKVDPIEYDSSQAGTYIVAVDMRTAFVNKFRQHAGQHLPRKFSLFLKAVHEARSVKELGDYWEMIWDLAVACPIQYLDEPFGSGIQYETPAAKGTFLQMSGPLRNYNFEVVVDGLSLRKPVQFPWPPKRRDSTALEPKPMTGTIYSLNTQVTSDDRPLRISAYLYAQDGQAIQPAQLRGLLIRIRNVAIGSYDPTFLGYSSIEGPRFNWLSGEIYADEGLENALNIDRDSFNEMQPHYVRLETIVHQWLGIVFSSVNKKTTQRSRRKSELASSKRRDSVIQILKEQLDQDYVLVEASDTEFPATLDVVAKKVLINPQSRYLPKAASARSLAQSIAVAFESALLLDDKDRREHFYKVLAKILTSDL